MEEEFKGYYPLERNEVYANEISACSDDGTEVPIMEIILPSRFSESSEEEVVRYLQEVAERVEASALLELPGVSRVRQDKTYLENAVMALPGQIRRDIRTGDEECVDFIRKNTIARRIEEGEIPTQYLFARYGVIPTELVDRYRAAGAIKDSSWYDSAFSSSELRKKGLGEMFNLKLILNEGVLPDREEMDVLLKHHVYSSRTLDISRSNYPDCKVLEVINFLYGNFPTAESIGFLKDVSDRTLEELAIQPINCFHKKIQEAIASQK